MISPRDKELCNRGYFTGEQPLGVFDGAKILRELYRLLTGSGIEVCFGSASGLVDAVLFVEAPTGKQFQAVQRDFSDARKVCFVMESPAIVEPDMEFLLTNVDLLLSWHFDVNHEKHEYLPYPKADKFYFSSVEECLNFKRFDFSMMAANKYSSSSNELYSLRRKVIKEFEYLSREVFHLFGPGWGNHHCFGLPYTNRLKKILRHTPPTSYKGVADNKIDCLARYKFSFAIENYRGSDGYISEKIHDCFMAGVVPIYSGDSNVSRIVPEGSFVLLDNFSSISECIDYCLDMPRADYLKKLEVIYDYTRSHTNSVYSTALAIYRGLAGAGAAGMDVRGS